MNTNNNSTSTKTVTIDEAINLLTTPEVNRYVAVETAKVEIAEIQERLSNLAKSANPLGTETHEILTKHLQEILKQLDSI